MKAIVVEEDKLVWEEVQTPDLRPGEVRIDVHATAINRADLLQRRGGYPPPPGASPIMGLECAGIVSEVGEGVSRVKAGDEVCALLAGGGYAEQVVVAAGQVLKIPTGISLAEAAAIPEVFATAYLNIYMEAYARPGDRVLLHAGASGVGTAAIQLCRELGNPCFVTLGSDDKLEACLQLGAEAGFVRHQGSFGAAVQQWAEDGVDIILDPVGGSYLADNLDCLGMEGRLVLIGLMGGLESQINLGTMLRKRLRIIGSTLRTRSIAAKAAVMDELESVVWPLIADGSIRPIIDRRYPITEADAAQARVASDETIGKVVLEVL